MVAVSCWKCKKSFKDPKALQGHKPFCKGRTEAIQQVLTKGHEVATRGAQSSSAKIPRIQGISEELERQEIRDIEQTNFDLPHYEPQKAVVQHPPPILLPSTRSGRKRRAPAALREFVPSSAIGALSKHIAQLVPPPPAAPDPAEVEQPAAGQNNAEDCSEVPAVVLQTEPNIFGMFRRYFRQPDRDLDAHKTCDTLCDSPSIETRSTAPLPDLARSFGPTAAVATTSADSSLPWFAPFLNASCFRLLHWVYTGGMTKSAAELNRLVQEVLLAEDFQVDDLRDGFSVQREQRRMDAHTDPTASTQGEGSGLPQSNTRQSSSARFNPSTSAEHCQAPPVSSSHTLPCDNASQRPPLVFSPLSPDVWRTGSVKIQVPKERVSHKSEEAAPEFEVEGLQYRPLTATIRSAFEDLSAARYEYTPYEQRFTKDEDIDPEGERVYSETYTCDAFLEEDKHLNSQPRNAEDAADVPYMVAALMLWSDSTHLTNFGTASLWPIYLYFGNLSKYIRALPTQYAAHHLAYIPSLPDTIQDFYMKTFGSLASAAVLKFLRSELMHAVWLKLLDDEFMQAYKYGILITCGDGVIRRVFPRFFTYSADYPERVLLASIRFLTDAPCPACLIQKMHIPDMGKRHDIKRRQNWRIDSSAIWDNIKKARKFIFEKGFGPRSRQVGRTLQASLTSLLPTRSAFSTRLGELGHNFYSMFVPDVLHEFDLGVWKHILIHLIRVLFAVGHDVVAEFNTRFRQVPTFGRSTIRRFSRNVSGLKKLAGRDFEDILQCIIPCIEGSLPPDLEKVVLDMLWELNLWMAMAKLRLHTESTLKILEETTRNLGAAVRAFARKCQDIATVELPGEVTARARRTSKKEAMQGGESLASSGSKPKGAKHKYLNLRTFKYHGISHIVDFIRQVGTSESYSTQTGELEHRCVKKFYGRTNKIRYAKQIADQTRRQRLLHTIHQQGLKATREQETAQRQARTQTSPAEPSTVSPPVPKKRGRPRKTAAVSLDATQSDPLPSTAFTSHHHISDSHQHHLNITRWLSENKTDLALKDFLPQLKDHLISRLTGREYDGDEVDYTDKQRDKVLFKNDRLYRHKVLRVNYTTYDMRRDQDSINPRTHPDVMILSQEDLPDDGLSAPDRHPYWYARVVAIFHAIVKYTGSGSQTGDWETVEFLWIRWFGQDTTAPCGFKARRLHRVGFLDNSFPGAFGFLNPAVIIRAVHIIPAFAHGRRDDLLGPSLVRHEDDEDEDYNYYYINMFVDRDMVMRYIGGGVGHKNLRAHIRIRNTIAAITRSSTSALEDCESDEEDVSMGSSSDADPDTSDDNVADGHEEEPEDDLEEETVDCGYIDQDEEEDAEEDQEEADGEHVRDGDADAVKEDDDDDEPWQGPEDGEDGVYIDEELDPSL